MGSINEKRAFGKATNQGQSSGEAGGGINYSKLI